MGVAITKAIQAHDVIAMGKHYVVNDQEYERFRTTVEVEERTLRELYLLPFEMLVNGRRHRRNDECLQPSARCVRDREPLPLTTILRDEWGFDGYVQSDFWCCR